MKNGALDPNRLPDSDHDNTNNDVKIKDADKP